MRATIFLATLIWPVSVQNQLPKTIADSVVGPLGMVEGQVLGVAGRHARIEVLLRSLLGQFRRSSQLRRGEHNLMLPQRQLHRKTTAVKTLLRTKAR